MQNQFEVNPATSIYFTMVDRDLGVERLFDQSMNDRQLSFSIKLYSLLFERAVIPDGASLYNDGLRRLALSSSTFNNAVPQLFSDGLIVWSQRSNAPSFSDLHEFMTTTHSWSASDTQAQHTYLEFLEQHCARKRITYDYRTTASTFTRLTAACLTNYALMESLGLSSVAKIALSRSERNRSVAEDGYARRTAIFEYATQLVP